MSASIDRMAVVIKEYCKQKNIKTDEKKILELTERIARICKYYYTLEEAQIATACMSACLIKFFEKEQGAKK